MSVIDSSALAGVLEPMLGDVRIDDLRVVTGGASRATWAFTAVTDIRGERSDGECIRGERSDGEWQSDGRELILRIGPPDEIHAGMELEAAALTRAAVSGAPVPHVLVADDSPTALGNPYLVCDFIGGETIVRRIQRALDDASRASLLTECADALAAIHHADPSDIGLKESEPLD